MLSNYLENYCYLRLYGTPDNFFLRLVKFKSIKNSGFDDVPKSEHDNNLSNEKLSQSISRARSKIFEYASCNEWEFFFTGTIDKEKYSRTDLKTFYKDFRKWINNQSVKYGQKINFLFIPELHADLQSWHIHGLISGIFDAELHKFVIGDEMGKGIADKVLKGDIIYNWIGYQKKFGFCSLSPVKNPLAVSKYITKYITKDLSRSVSEVGSHIYYHSRGLNTSELIKKGFIDIDFNPDFSNEYLMIKEFPFDEEILKYFTNHINNC